MHTLIRKISLVSNGRKSHNAEKYNKSKSPHLYNLMSSSSSHSLREGLKYLGQTALDT